MSNRTHHRNTLRVRPWTALALVLTAIAGATDPGIAAEPVTHAAEPITHATEPLSRAAERADAPGRAHALTTAHIGRIFFSPAERRSRHSGGPAAAPGAADPTNIRIAPREHLLVNGALSSSTQGRAVWVNGAAVENTDRDKSAWTDRNGTVWLINGTHGTHLMRPGQTIDRNGAIEDLLPPGAVTRR